MNAAEAKEFANRWLEAAGTHDIDAIVSYYAEDAIIESPVVVTLMKEPGGIIRGAAAVREYFTRAMKAFPHLSLHLIEAAAGLSSITAWYVNQRGSRTCAYLELDSDGKIVRNVTHYSE